MNSNIADCLRMRVQRRSCGAAVFCFGASPLRASNPLEDKVLDLIEPVAADLGLRLVRVRLNGLKRKTLQIMAERIEDGGMGLEDCERLSRAISPVLEAADPINDAYNLEVSSPGIDRPLVREEDFARFAGHEAKLETLQMIDGRRRWRGTILGAGEGVVRLATKEGEAALPFSQIHEARLILTDALIEEDFRRARQADRVDDQPDPAVTPESAPPRRKSKSKPPQGKSKGTKS
jgi:ribosome maturation factor RimP